MQSELSKTKISHQKLGYINAFRTVAIIFVVAMHAVFSTRPVEGSFLQVFLGDGTVFFVFISGFLFQYLSDSFSYQVYLKKKLINVICPYLVTSVFGIAVRIVSCVDNPFGELNPFLQIPMFLSTGFFHNTPTWYIPMTCVFFLCAPLLLRLERREVLGGKRLLFLLLSGLILVPVFVPRVVVNDYAGLSALQNYMQAVKNLLFLTVLFFPIYILGMYAAADNDFVRLCYTRRKIWWLCALVLFAVAWGWVYIQFPDPHTRLLVSKIIFSLLIIGYLVHYASYFNSPTKLNRILDTVALYSFSIFFFHMYFLWVFDFFVKYVCGREIEEIAAMQNFWVWFGYMALRFLFSFLGSLSAAMFIKRVLMRVGVKNTRWLIGA